MRLVMEAADRLGAPYLVFNQRVAQHADIRLEVRNGRVDGALRIGGAEWPFSDLSGVYVRLMGFEDLPESKPRGRTPPDARVLRKSQFAHSCLAEWLELAACRVMNRDRAMASNMSKPYQAQYVVRAGFRTPATLVTNDPDEVRGFVRAHRRVIYKSISSVRSKVQLLDDARLSDLDRVRHLPTQFQAFVEGTNIRVHVTGDTVIATEIRTDGTDYRYAGGEGFDVEMAAVDLPAEIAERCLRLSRLLGLPLCGIDLKRAPGGDYYCFEVNPSPAFSYYQEHTGQDIAGAIVRYLHASHLPSNKEEVRNRGG